MPPGSLNDAEAKSPSAAPALSRADAADDRGAVGIVFDEAVVAGISDEEMPGGQTRVTLPG
jgi:hypothetical protein